VSRMSSASLRPRSLTMPRYINDRCSIVSSSLRKFKACQCSGSALAGQMAGSIRGWRKMNADSPATSKEWLEPRAELVAAVITTLGFVTRAWTASGTFLNPDEALHFRLANQNSLSLVYRMSLTASHPPLLTLLLYYWRELGTSEFWLRMPSVLAGTVFCWMFYKWLSGSAGMPAGLIGLLFVAFLPPVVLLTAEVRQYGLLLAFLMGALYFLDEALARRSPRCMAAFSLLLYLAFLSHYSAFLFAAALGIYALIRIFAERTPIRVAAVWATGQVGALALALFLYRSHISKLGVGESRTALQGWMSEFFLSHSYFDPAQDHRIPFLLGHTFGVFQYFFGQLAVGDVMGVLFVVGVVLLLQGKVASAPGAAARRLGLLILLLFSVAVMASLAHVYPYGGTRHVAFLTIPGIAAVSVAIASLARQRWRHGVVVTALILAACVAFEQPRRPSMSRADQRQAHMKAAMEFVRENIGPSDVIFTDYMSDLVVGHYLCRQQPIVFETSNPDFEAFDCGRRVVSAGYRAGTLFTQDNFVDLWKRLVQFYRLEPGNTVWVMQAGWDVKLADDLQRNYSEFHDLRIESFGRNIKVFKMTAGQPIPSVPR
jgi:hypothetical protein